MARTQFIKHNMPRLNVKKPFSEYTRSIPANSPSIPIMYTVWIQVSVKPSACAPTQKLTPYSNKEYPMSLDLHLPN